MADRSLIEWTDSTWNPITGCTPVSAGCDHCYAKRMAERFGGPFGKFYPPRFVPGKLDEPLRWKKPRRIFVCSMGDLFHEDVTDEQIQAVFGVMSSAGQHAYMVLTKRPERMREWMLKTSLAECQAEMVTRDIEMRSPQGRRDRIGDSTINGPWPLPTVMLGVTAENQETADQRIPILLQTPAAKRFVSIEPMLSAVDLRPYLPHEFNREPHCPWCEDCIPRGDHGSDWWKNVREDKHGPFLDWVICGGETGPGARPMHPDWPRSIRDQCQAAGVPFFFKQWGEWGPGGGGQLYHRGSKVHQWSPPSGAVSIRVGKKAAGCLLNGREWKEFPA